MSKLPHTQIYFPSMDGCKKICVGKKLSELYPIEDVKAKVSALAAAVNSGQVVDAETAAWVAGLNTLMANKLAAVGLISRPDALQNPVPEATGDWLDSGIFRSSEGIKCFGIGYLQSKCPYKRISREMWYQWISSPTVDLNPAINDGKIRAYLAPSPRPQNEKVIVWVRQDADQIAKRYIYDGEDPEEKRKTVDWIAGEWQSKNVWEDAEYGDCLRDEALAKKLCRSQPFFGYWRRHVHPALGRKPRFRRLPKQNGMRRVFVSCFDDFKKIVDWDKEREKQGQSQVVPPNWKHRREIAAVLNLVKNRDNFCLKLALDKFRSQHPEGAVRKTKKTRKNVLLDVWYFDLEAFKSWLGGRSVQEVAPLVLNGKKWAKRLKKCTLLIQFILTHGFYSPRKFQNFLAEPPTAPLTPCQPVLSNDLSSWLEKAGFYGKRVITAARKCANVKNLQKGFPPVHYSYLEGPITIEPFDGSPDESPAAADAAKGIPASNLTTCRQTDRQVFLLKAMWSLKAISFETRTKLPKIVKRAEGPEADPDNYKHDMAALARNGLIETRSRRNGGSWLTEKGLAIVQK